MKWVRCFPFSLIPGYSRGKQVRGGEQCWAGPWHGRVCIADLRSPGLELDRSQVGTEASPASITGFHPGAQGGAMALGQAPAGWSPLCRPYG